MHVVSGDLWAGAESQTYDLCNALSQSTELSVFASVLNEGKLSRSLQNAGIPTTVLDESRCSSVSLFRQLLTHLRLVRPHIVHTHRRKENIFGGLAARQLGIPSLRTIHGGREQSHSPLKLDSRLLNLLDSYSAHAWQGLCIAVSQDLAQRVSGRIPSRRLRVIHNGISEARVQREALPNPRVTMPAEKVRLCFLGRLVRVKRVNRILEVLRLLCDEAPDRYHLFVLGDGPEHAQLVGQCAELGIAENVNFLGHRDDATACLARMDCLILASEHEGLPMVILEALCLGVPFVAPPVGGIPELAKAASFGVISDSRSAKSLASAVQHAIGEGSRSGERTNRLPREWTIECTASRYLEAYRYLACQTPLPAS